MGVGGIGSIASIACVRLGLGKLTLVDLDIVEASNLNRQLLYSKENIGSEKINSAMKSLSSHSLSSRVEGQNFDIFEDWQRFIMLVKKADFVFNALDLPEVKKLAVANLCLKYRKPMIFSGTDPINGHAGMIVFQQPSGNPCYNCLTAANFTVYEEYLEMLNLENINRHKRLPIAEMSNSADVSSKTTVYSASIVSMMGIDLMIHWIFQWLESLPNRVIIDLYNFSFETWIETNSCCFCNSNKP